MWLIESVLAILSRCDEYRGSVKKLLWWMLLVSVSVFISGLENILYTIFKAIRNLKAKLVLNTDLS